MFGYDVTQQDIFFHHYIAESTKQQFAQTMGPSESRLKTQPTYTSKVMATMFLKNIIAHYLLTKLNDAIEEKPPHLPRKGSM